MSWIILIFILILASVKNRNKKRELTVSVIIPAFNEEKTVGEVVKVVKSLNYIYEIIVVDDGSTDNTGEVAKSAGAMVISHIKNRGKGAAIKTGFNNSKGSVAVFLDADIQNLTAAKVDKIIQPILINEADVTKTKFKREAGRVTELTAKPLLNFFFPEIKFEQPLSGQFAAKRSFLKDIKLEDDYGVDVGIVLDADVRGMRIKEVDIGKIDHVLSSLHELNIVATEVVRTIVDRATEYGR
ncbi:MAG TPA: glycosyltransferase, partial [Methanobacteriaceae archaeon]|nr:glycosyltransferase [Methanobacteriaceae archaeon]